jgi:hypothetical protein
METKKYESNLKFKRTPLPIPAFLIIAQQNLSNSLLKNFNSKKTTGKELLEFCRSEGWDAKILGNAPLPEHPYRLGTWLIIPSHLDTNPMPERAMERIQTLFENGHRPKGFFIIHEAPKELAPTIQKPEIPKTDKISPEFKAKLRSALSVSGKALGGVAVLAGSLTLGLIAILVALPVIVLGAAIVIDPILVAVTEDNTWVEIDRWWN